MAVYKPPKDPTNWWIDYRVNGKRYRRKIGPAKRKAEQALNTIKAQIAAGTYFDAHRDRLTFAKLAERYLSSPKNPEKRTLDRDRSIIEQHLNPYFGGKVADTITAEDVKHYVDHRKRQASERTGRPPKPATINRERAVLSVIFSTGMLHGDVTHNPVGPAPRLAEHNVRNHELPPEKLPDLMEALPPHLRPVVATCYYTGMRLGEVLGLTWDRVDLSRGTITLEAIHTKTKTARTLPIPARLLIYLMELRRVPGVPYVFTYNGKRLKGVLPRTWKAALRRAGLDETLHVHDLRHQFATMALRAGNPEEFVMRYTGHKTRSVFSRYVDATESDLRRLVRNMDTYWTPSGEGVTEGVA